MLTRTFVAAAGGLAMLLGAAPLSALHAQTQDSASRRTWGTNPGVQSPPTKGAPAQTGALATDQPAAGDDAEARRAIEFDGYKNVHVIVKGRDGLWHARAMRGRAEIAVTVDATGNVSAE